MRRSLSCFLLSMLIGAPYAVADEFVLAGQRLELRAQARACYLGVVKLYDVDYLRESGQTEEAARCVRVSYLRDFSASMLDTATRKTFADLHGAEVAMQHQQWLERIGLAYQPVGPGDEYTYCVDANAGGVLLRDGQEVTRIPSTDFAERFLQIWVASDALGEGPEWRFNPC